MKKLNEVLLPEAVKVVSGPKVAPLINGIINKQMIKIAKYVFF